MKSIGELRWEALGITPTGTAMRAARAALKDFYDHVQTIKRYRERPQALQTVQWNREEDVGSDHGITITLTEEDHDLDVFFSDHTSSVNEVRPDGGLGRPISIVDQDPDTGTLVLEKEPDTPRVCVRPNTLTQKRQLDAIRWLQDGPLPDHAPLLQLLQHEPVWPEPRPATEVDTWHLLTEDARPGTLEQRDFVSKALRTPDFAILEGPPGSGKTTAICELAVQLVRQGQRVLLCASTHVAVDNVLERLIETSTDELVVPLRVGRASSISERVRHLRLDERLRAEREAIVEHLAGQSHPTLAQERLLGIAQDQPRDLERYLLDAANVVGGTVEGILHHPDIGGRPSGMTRAPFDVLIVDEASKTPFLDFLIPGVYARRWILVGDIRQLSPFVDENELSSSLVAMAGRTPADLTTVTEGLRTDGEESHLDDTELWAGAIAWRLIQRFQHRLRPERDFERFDAQLSRLLDVDDAELTEAVDRLERIAMPSVLECLQRGVGGDDSRLDNALYRGLPAPVLAARHTVLRHQHRMHPELSRLPRSSVYGGEALLDPPDAAKRRKWSYQRYHHRVVWIDAPRSGEEITRASSSFEASVVADELTALLNWLSRRRGEQSLTVAVLSFYRDQVRELRHMLRRLTRSPQHHQHFVLEADGAQLLIDLNTIDGFQGHEGDVVFLSIGKGHPTSFTRSLNRLNVAITRARYQLVVVGNLKPMGRGDGDLLAQLARSASVDTAWRSDR